VPYTITIHNNAFKFAEANIDHLLQFYQVPASPRRSLIQDYDDNIVKSRRILEGHREKRKKTKAAKRSGLIDGILAGCASPRRTKIVVTRRSIIETQQLPTESVIDPAVQRVSGFENGLQ
jgi:hypothetical protein